MMTARHKRTKKLADDIIAEITSDLNNLFERQGKTLLTAIQSRRKKIEALRQRMTTAKEQSSDGELLGFSNSSPSKKEILAAFRKQVKHVHPDRGGDSALFQELLEARDRLLEDISLTEELEGHVATQERLLSKAEGRFAEWLARKEKHETKAQAEAQARSKARNAKRNAPEAIKNTGV
jgi:hypothetical protein